MVRMLAHFSRCCPHFVHRNEAVSSAIGTTVYQWEHLTFIFGPFLLQSCTLISASMRVLFKFLLALLIRVQVPSKY